MCRIFEIFNKKCVIVIDTKCSLVYISKTHHFQWGFAPVAQSVERNHGKVEVCGPIPHGGYVKVEKGARKNEIVF